MDKNTVIPALEEFKNELGKKLTQNIEKIQFENNKKKKRAISGISRRSGLSSDFSNLDARS